MGGLPGRLNAKKEKDLRVLRDFVFIHCRENHRERTKAELQLAEKRLRAILGDSHIELCQECQRLLYHGTAKLLLCMKDPKPMCKKCETHCYAPGYRDKIKEVMRFSGMYLVKHGRIDLLVHYFL